jgi:hypothetical protein
MDVGKFNLFIKMVIEEYKLGQEEIDILGHRLLADDNEFEKVWKLYQKKSSRMSGGDQFKVVLRELLT